MNRLCCLACLGLVFAVVLGCSPQNAPPPPNAKVSGKVALNHKPMTEGEIRFNIAGQPPKTFTIKDGEFSGEAFVGKNRIDIVLEKDGPPSTTDTKKPMRINTVTHKALEADVTKDGPNTFSFEVSSK